MMRADSAFACIAPELAAFQSAGVFTPAETMFAETIHRLAPNEPWQALLAAALAMRAPRQSAVSVDLSTVTTSIDVYDLATPSAERTDIDAADLVANLPWPDAAEWRTLLRASSVVADEHADKNDPRPLVLVGDRLYLDCFWRDEQFVAAELSRRAELPAADWAVSFDAAAIAGLSAEQQQAVRMVLSSSLTVLTGGPGTGKTRVVAEAIRVLADGNPNVRVRLAAPTGKAAARLAEAIGQHGEIVSLEPPTTLHRLLGMGPRHRARRVIDADMVVVDECSMVALPLMAELLASLADDTRLVLVGDANQLPSVEAGTVFVDAVQRATTPGDPLCNRGIQLTYNHRSAAAPGIAALAEAILARNGMGIAAAMQLDGVSQFDRPNEVREVVLAAALEMHRAAAAGDVAGALAALRSVRVLCAHRRGPDGVGAWNARVERWLRAAVPGLRIDGWYVGRPILVTKNDPINGLHNGDMGVVMGGALADRVAIDGRAEPIHTVQLANVETVHAMTVHNAQGSEFDTVVVVPAQPGSPLGNPQLLYTAITRAKARVAVKS